MAEPVLTIPEAASRLKEVIDRARCLRESTLLTDNGEPVARVVPVPPTDHTVGELADWWASHERLDPHEAELFAADIEEGRRLYNKPPVPPWD